MIDLPTWGWALIGVAGIMGALVVGVVYMSIVLAWSDAKTTGVEYFGLAESARARFRTRLKLHARLLHPLFLLLARLSKPSFAGVSFAVDGVSGPKGTCSEESFRQGIAYTPRPEDVFVVTQMKCGTTWMQNVVYETLCRGTGDLADTGTALYSISPWLESTKSVAVGDAPTVGVGRERRVIKTHFPARLCPTASGARYIYVSRHPGSCFASCVDFIRENMGPFTPSLDAIEAWFCSRDDMWWGGWPDHVAGWWNRAEEDSNVLWVAFEEMKHDLGAVVRRVAAFLEIDPLEPEEEAAVVRKCSFQYMRDHQAAFEMHPPHLMAVNANLFIRGSADRYRDIAEETNDRITRWCEEGLAATGIPTESAYPLRTPG